MIMDSKQLKAIKEKIEFEREVSQYYFNELSKDNPDIDKREEKLAYNKGVLSTYEYVLSLLNGGKI